MYLCIALIKKRVNMYFCNLCQRRINTLRQVWTLDCEHEYHIRCLQNFIRHSCPRCHTPLSENDFQLLYVLHHRNYEYISGSDSGYESK